MTFGIGLFEHAVHCYSALKILIEWKVKDMFAVHAGPL